MNPALLERRAVLRGGAMIVGGLAVTGLPSRPAAASSQVDAPPLTGALAGWLVLRSDGAGHIDLVQLDEQSRPMQKVATETILPMTSVAAAARQANAVAMKVVAASWNVSVHECTCVWGRIEHRTSGRSISFNIWTDFA